MLLPCGYRVERLAVAAWSDTYQEWRFEDDEEGPAMPPGLSNIEGTVTVMCWLFIPDIPGSSLALAYQIRENLAKQRPGDERNDNPEDHDNGEEFEWDFIDPEED